MPTVTVLLRQQRYREAATCASFGNSNTDAESGYREAQAGRALDADSIECRIRVATGCGSLSAART